jgi:hypothetical protein
MATPASGKSGLKPIRPVAVWITQGKPVPKAWASQRFSTQADGALSVTLSPSQMMIKTARSTEGRFYHFSAESP